MKKILLLAGCISLAFYGCGEDDPAKPDPTPNPQPTELKACFTVDKDFIDSAETVTFTNCSENQKSNDWNFGSGTTPSTAKTPPPLTFNQRGTFPVRLIVRNADATKSDTAIKEIVVGRHSLTKINVKKFKATDGSGNPWDSDGTGPDIKIQYGPNSNPNQYTTSLKQDASGAFSFDITPNIVLDNGNNGGWQFRLLEENSGSVRPMTTFGGTNNPVYPSRGTTSPFSILNTADYQVELEWVLVK